MLKKIGDGISLINKWVFSAASFVIYPLILVVMFEVFMRYVLNSPTNWSYDMTWILFGTFTYLGGAHVLREGGHVKADILLELVPHKVKLIITALCYLALFFPMNIMVIYSCFNYVSKSFQMGEVSNYTSWGPVLWPWKLIMMISFILLAIQGVVEFIRLCGELFKKKEGDKE